MHGSQLGRMRWWIEKLIAGQGVDTTEFVVLQLAAQARKARTPAAFCIWATARPGLDWVSESAWSGRAPKRKDGGQTSVADIL